MTSGSVSAHWAGHELLLDGPLCVTLQLHSCRKCLRKVTLGSIETDWLFICLLFILIVDRLPNVNFRETFSLLLLMVFMLALASVGSALALFTVIGLSAAEADMYAHGDQGPRAFEAKHAKGGVEAPSEGMQNSLYRHGYFVANAPDIPVDTQHALVQRWAARDLDAQGSRADNFLSRDEECGDAEVKKSSCRLSQCFSNVLDTPEDTKHSLDQHFWGREFVRPDAGLRHDFSSSRVGVAVAAPHGVVKKSLVRHAIPLATAVDILDESKHVPRSSTGREPDAIVDDTVHSDVTVSTPSADIRATHMGSYI